MPNETEQHSELGYFQIALRGQEGDYSTLGQITAFLYNFNVLYEFSRLSVDPGYADQSINQNTANRNVKRLLPKDQLAVQSLSVRSPIALTAVVLGGIASATTLLAFAEKIETILNFPINREILIQQRDKLRLENEQSRRDGQVDSEIKSLQREKLLLENEELRRTLNQPDTDLALQTSEGQRPSLELRDLQVEEHYTARIVKKLQESEVRITKLEISYVRELPTKRSSDRDAEVEI